MTQSPDLYLYFVQSLVIGSRSVFWHMRWMKVVFSNMFDVLLEEEVALKDETKVPAVELISVRQFDRLVQVNWLR